MSVTRERVEEIREWVADVDDQSDFAIAIRDLLSYIDQPSDLTQPGVGRVVETYASGGVVPPATDGVEVVGWMWVYAGQTLIRVEKPDWSKWGGDVPELIPLVRQSALAAKEQRIAELEKQVGILNSDISLYQRQAELECDAKLKARTEIAELKRLAGEKEGK